MDKVIVQGSNVVSVVPGMVPLVDERAVGEAWLMIAVNLLRSGCEGVQVILLCIDLARSALSALSARGGMMYHLRELEQIPVAITRGSKSFVYLVSITK